VDSSNSSAAAFAEVEVDTETGEVKLLKMVLAHDIGRAINPMTVEGQLEGGMGQGIGYALTEDYFINKGNGVVESDNFTTYKIPSTLDMPETEVIIVEQPVASGPFGAKSVGESPMNAIAPAIANAIYDAVGVRIKDLPITPEKVVKVLRAKNLLTLEED
jgi:xanthine dehydrogenase molybdenum-binding subunit